MKTLQIKKGLKNAKEMLEVINSQTLKGKDEDLKVWKNINEAIKSIDKAREILHLNK